MKSILIILLVISSSLSAWETESYDDINKDLNCKELKSYDIEDSDNKDYQKCLIFDNTFKKYRRSVIHFNKSNESNKKYTIKNRQIWVNYIFSKTIYESWSKELKKVEKEKMDFKKKEWNYESLKIVYEGLKIHKPYIMLSYKRKLENWLKTTEFKDEVLMELYNQKISYVQENIWSRYQYRLNVSYTGFVVLRNELRKRGLYIGNHIFDYK